MSLINEVMKNVDQREEENKASQEGTKAPYQPVGLNKSCDRRFKPVCFTVLAIIAAGAATQYYFSHQTPTLDIQHPDNHLAHAVTIKDHKLHMQAVNPEPNKEPAKAEPKEVKTKPEVKRAVTLPKPAITITPVKQQATVKPKPVEPVKPVVKAPAPKPKPQPVLKPLRLEVSATELHQKALNALQAGQYEKALSQLKQANAKDPELVQVSVSLSSLYMKLNQLQQAKSAAQMGLVYHPESPELLTALGNVFFQEGAYDQAQRLLLGHAPNLADHPTYYSLMANIYLKQNKPQLAVGIYHQILEKDPGNPSWWTGMGIAMQQAGMLQEAQTAYNQALKMSVAQPALRAFILAQLQQLG